MGAAVVISELEIIRMRMGRVLGLLLSDVVDFRIGDRVMVHAWLELEGGIILVAARRLSVRELQSSTREGTADVNRGVIRAGRQTRFFPGAGIRRCGGAGADRDCNCEDHGSLIIRSRLSLVAH